MPSQPLSRRAFLAAGGGALLLAACGGSSPKDSAAKAGAGAAGATGLSASRLAIEPYVATTPHRLAFILATYTTQVPSCGPSTEIRIAPPDGSFGPAQRFNVPIQEL